MPLSVVDPISPAIERMKWILFQPFDFGKWLRLGFCAFLMGLAQGGGGGTGNFGGSGPGGNGDFDRVTEWIRDHLAIVILVVVAVVLIGMAIGLVLTWLSSRGHFMFLDGVVHNRGAVVAPWHEYRREGNSLFLFRVCMGFLMLGLMLSIGGVCFVVALPDIQAHAFGGFAAGAIALGIFSFLASMLTFGIISVLLADFVVPIMYLRRIPVLAAWREFSASMLAGNAPLFALYFLMKIAIGMIVGFCAFAALCLTCCLAAIPYVGSVILLPLSVFGQAYPLYFIEQFGPSWRVFPRPGEPAGPEAISGD